MRYAIILSCAALAITACSVREADEGETTASEMAADEPAAGNTPIPVEPDGGIGDGAPPIEDMVLGQESGMSGESGEPETPAQADSGDSAEALPKSFPTAIRGTWRATAGDAPTREQCDNTVSKNMGNVLTVRADSYSFFETGGRFISVKARDAGSIRAVFDTTYADTPTRDELEFRVDPVARTLTVQNFDTGERSTTTYRRCPR